MRITNLRIGSDCMNTRRFPRTLAEAFGPREYGPVIECYSRPGFFTWLRRLLRA